MHCDVQRELAAGHHFVWSRDVCKETMLIFHLDRKGKLSYRPNGGKDRTGMQQVLPLQQRIGSLKLPPSDEKCFAGWTPYPEGVWARVGMPEWGDGKRSTRGEPSRNIVNATSGKGKDERCLRSRSGVCA